MYVKTSMFVPMFPKSKNLLLSVCFLDKLDFQMGYTLDEKNELPLNPVLKQ